jgi:gluconolactonase
MKRIAWLCAASMLTFAACSGNNGTKVGSNNANGSTNGSPNGATNGATNAGTDDMGTGPTDDMGGPDAATDMGTSADAGPDATVDMGPPPDPLEGIGDVTLVQEGFEFTEGPHWFAGDGVLRFTDIPANTIYELSPPDDITEWRNPSGNANGLAAGPMGQLLAAEHGGRRISTTRDDQAETLVEEYEGNQFNSPNDLVVHSGGWIYFTDPPYGLGGRTREIDFNGLFRYVPGDETLVAEWEGEIASRPNGVALSPDESILYMADTAASKVYAFDIAGDGSLSGQREFADASNPDGMAIDTDGNLYVTSSDGIDVFAPDGSKWGTIGVPRQPANCAFGGPDGTVLFITARQGLYRVEMVVEGIY